MRGEQFLRRAVGRHRRSRAVQFAHRLAHVFEQAYLNVGADASTDGEFDLIERLGPANLACVIDAGANNGDWTIRAAQAWSAASVHAFEIAPPTADALERRLQQAGLSSRVTVNRCGLSSEVTTQTIRFYPDHPDLTCDRDRFPDYRSESMTVPVTTGDAYRSARGLDRIDFLKIDVEGAEMDVLRGCAESLKAGAIRMIQFEYGAFSIDTRVLLQDYYRLLGVDYVMGKVFPGHVEFKDYDWRDETFQFSNYLCVRREESSLVALAAGG